MKSLMILVATTTLVSGLRETTPGFAVDFRSFGGSRIHQDLPYREQPRSFREAGPPPGHQTYRTESFRDYRPPFAGREETRIFRDDPRASLKDEAREGFKEEFRTFNENDAGPFRDEARAFKDENRGYNDERRIFRDERIYREAFVRDGPGHFSERPFGEEQRPFREEQRPFREEQRPFRDDVRTFRDGPYEPRPFRDEIRHFRDDFRPFRNDVKSFRDEPSEFREERPFRQDSAPLRNEPRPFREESRPFKDELLSTQESRGLAEAQHRFNQDRQPLSYGGHSNYLNYGNHGLGYASIPSSVLPLENNPPRLSTGMMITDMSIASTKSPSYLKSNTQETTSPNDVQSSITSSHISVTLAPDVGSTPSQSTSGNALTRTQQQTNENLVDGASGSGNPNAVTSSASGDTSVTPKVLFTSGPAATSSASMGIRVDTDNSAHRANGPTSNSLQATKQAMNAVATSSSYFPSETRPEVPEALVNYVFKYPVPEEPKIRYTFRSSPQADTTFNQIQSLPLIQHHQTPKYTLLPELKISGLSDIRAAPTVNYISSPAVSKVPFLSSSNPGLTLNSYASENLQPVNFASNLIQLDRETRYSPIDHQLTALQSNQYQPLRQFASNGFLPQLGNYGNLGQPQQTTNAAFNQGLQLQLGGFGGIDYSAITGSADASRGTSVNLGPSTFSKVSSTAFPPHS